jgi:hypothetical protein
MVEQTFFSRNRRKIYSSKGDTEQFLLTHKKKSELNILKKLLISKKHERFMISRLNQQKLLVILAPIFNRDMEDLINKLVS